MRKTYMAATNSAAGGVALDQTGGDVEVVKLIVGNPTTSSNIYLYDENNVGNVTNTTGLAAKLTIPASLATGQLPFVIDLTDANGHGITLGMGGTVAIDASLQLTVVWDYAQQNTSAI